MTQGHFFKQSLTGWNSEFSFSKSSCFTKAEEPNLSYYLPIDGDKIIGFMPLLVLCEMQLVLARFFPSRVGLLITPTASLQRGKTPPHECLGYDTKQSDSEALVRLELWGIQCTP